MTTSQSWLAWAALLLSCGSTLSKHINSFAGPYIAFAHRAEPCPSDGTAVITLKNSHFNPARPFERQWIQMNITLKTEFDDSWWGHVSLALRNNNEWKENALVFHFPGGCCSAVREHHPNFFNILASHQPELYDRKTPCRFKPRQHQFENQTIRWEFPHFPVLPYGHYRFTATSGKAGSRVKKACLDVDCEVIPKPV